jgi:hypothetical protein
MRIRTQNWKANNSLHEQTKCSLYKEFKILQNDIIYVN